MNCPACGNTLRKFDFKKNELDICDNCDGAFFDDAELQQTITALIEDGKIPDAKIETEKSVISAHKINEEKRHCPRCSSQMNKINYAYDSNVIIDKCAKCGGMWTDQGELQKLAVFVKGNPALNRLGEAIAKDSANKFKNIDDSQNRRAFYYPLFMPHIILPIGDDADRQKSSYVVISLIAINIIIYILQTIFCSGEQISYFYSRVGFVPSEAFRSLDGIYGIFSSMFIHAGLLHLSANMLFMWIFADNIEDFFGHITFFFLYLFFGVAASLLHYFFYPNSTIPLVGASGAVAGTMGAYMALYPSARIKTLFYGAIYQIPAFAYLGIWIFFQLASAYISYRISSHSNIAWFAHIGGFIAGIIVGLIKKISTSEPSQRIS